MDKSVVALSGGQDSTTTFFIAKKETDIVHLVFFDYGQQHLKAEFDCAVALSERERLPLLKLHVPALKSAGWSELTNPDGDVNAKHQLDPNLPASFVPGRNIVFLTLVAAVASRVGANIVWTGLCQTDYSGYPDCRRATINSLETTINLGFGNYQFAEGQDRLMHRPELLIRTPLMYTDKANTFKIADELGELEWILEHTHTCYKGVREKRHSWGYGCESCPACIIRQRGYVLYMQHKAAKEALRNENQGN